MRRMWETARSWRPRTGTVVAALVVAAGGVAWGATRAADNTVITACVAPPSGPQPGALIYSSNGTCNAGDTTVQWNQQGPQGAQGLVGSQGPPGQQGIPDATVAFGPSTYLGGFTISAVATTKGNYAFEGSVNEYMRPTVRRTFSVTCSLFAGPQGGSATQLTSETQSLVYNPKKRTFTPPYFNGPSGLTFVEVLDPLQVPVEVYYSCKRASTGYVKFTDPTLTLDIAHALHLHVGPALPIQHMIGPGPLRKVNGGT